jgi:type II secretory pathway component PulJ
MSKLRQLVHDLAQAEKELEQLRVLLKADCRRESTRRAYDKAHNNVKKLASELYGFNVLVSFVG